MRPDAAMQADLHHAAGIARRFEHRAAFIHRVPGRLLDKDVRAGLHRIDRLQRVPVIRRGDDHDLRLLLLQQFAVILVRLRRIAG
jgi:hypothetical protein